MRRAETIVKTSVSLMPEHKRYKHAPLPVRTHLSTYAQTHTHTTHAYCEKEESTSMGMSFASGAVSETLFCCFVSQLK